MTPAARGGADRTSPPARVDPEPFRIPWKAGALAALAYPAAGHPDAPVTLILAHGAGAPQTHRFMVAYARGLTARGVAVVTFNFPYMEQGRRAPDRADQLEACYRTVIEVCRERLPPGGRLAIGGKSMGGRIASQVAGAESDPPAELLGLVFLGYPLHPPGHPERPRSAHLPRVRAPMLFVQGSRDGFGTPEELGPVLDPVGDRATLHVVEGGDHSFAVPGRQPGRQEQVHDAIQRTVAHWLHGLVADGSRTPSGTMPR